MSRVTIEKMNHINFKGRILIIGFGAIGQAILPLLCKHLTDTSKITVIDKLDKSEEFKNTGIAFQQHNIIRQNMEEKLSMFVSKGDMVINVSLNIDTCAIIRWCQMNDVLYTDTSIERWEDEQDETIFNLADRTLYGAHQS